MATGINDRGEIVGYYLDGSNARDIGGEYTDYQPGTQYTPLPAFPVPLPVLDCRV
jgi:hypothetical protein